MALSHTQISPSPTSPPQLSSPHIHRTWLRSARTIASRIGVGAVVCVLLGLGAALITPATAVAGEVSASVLPGQGPPLPDPIVPEHPTRTPAPPAPTVPGPTQPGSAVPGPAQPVPAVPGPAVPGPAVPGSDAAAGSSCGIWDVSACINEAVTGMLRAAVTEVVNPGLELLSDTLLQTPAPSTIPRLGELWQISWQLTVSVYGIVILLGALIVMGHQSVQTRYGLREIGPRLVVGFVAGWLTLPMADMAVQIANAVSDALLGPGDEQAGMRALAALVQSSLTGPGFVVLLFGLMVAVALIAVLVGYILRVVAIIVLVAAAPLVVMWHALPQTDGIARWWWRALAALLSIQIIQSVVLSIAVTILLPPAGSDAASGGGGRAPMQVLGLTDSGWVSLLVLGALLWVLVKVPGWAWSQIRLGGGGRSLLGTVVRTAIAIKTGGLLRSALTTAAASRAGRKSGNAGPRAAGGGGEDGDPYAHTPVFAGGQLGLPLSGLKRRPRPTPAPAMPRSNASTGAGRARRGVQLALPLGQDWPENRPVADRNGQWALPIDAERVARPAQPRGGFAPHTPTETAPAAGRGQLRFPSSGQWPETQPVLGRDGQYRLPIPARRHPRPRTPALPPAPAAPPTVRAAGRTRQLSFDDLARDLDPFRGNRPLAGGQYPLPLPGLTRQPRPPDRPRTPPTPSPSARTAGRTPERPTRPVPGQTRLPIPTTPPRTTPAPSPPPTRATRPTPQTPKGRSTASPPQPPPPPTSTPPPSPPRRGEPRRGEPRRRPGQENTP